VVCRGFASSPWLTGFLEEMGRDYGRAPTHRSLFCREEVPVPFLEHVRKAGDLFMQLQENVIENNLHYWKSPLDKAYLKDLAEIQLQVSGWCRGPALARWPSAT
jgi:hypothetical protein